MRAYAFRFGDESWTQGGTVYTANAAEARKAVAEYRKAWNISRGRTEIQEIEPVIILGESLNKAGHVRIRCGAEYREVPPEMVNAAFKGMKDAQLRTLDEADRLTKEATA